MIFIVAGLIVFFLVVYLTPRVFDWLQDLDDTYENLGLALWMVFGMFIVLPTVVLSVGSVGYGVTRIFMN